ncbi:8861_t:CDS:2, partial [Dentiscutata erythropus]
NKGCFLVTSMMWCDILLDYICKVQALLLVLDEGSENAKGW